MAGWSKRVDGSGLESFRSPKNDIFINHLLKEVNGCSYFRSFPPMLGDGKTVDLCKLYLVVREKGGYQRVCNSGSWGIVAKECGFDLSSGLALKLVYVKYLDTFERTMLGLKKPDNENGALGFSAVRMDLELDLKDVLMKISDEKKKNEEHANIDLSNGIEVQDFVGSTRYSEDCVNVKGIDEKMSVVYAEEDSKLMNQNEDVQRDTDDIGLRKLSGDEEDCVIRKRNYSDEKNSVIYDEEHSKFVTGNGDVQCDTNDIGLMKLSGYEEDCVIRKRKYSDEKPSVVYDEEHLKFVSGNGDVQCDTNDIGLMKLSGDEEDCVIRKRKYSDEKTSVVYDEEHLKFVNGNGDVQCGRGDTGLTKLSGDEVDDITRQRKRESYLDMLKWVTELAKDPCDPAIGQLPEKSKWKSYGNEVVWKKVLLVRNEMLLQGNVDSSTQSSVWQQKQKMHPSMYDDNSGSERLRCSQRVLSAKDSLKSSGSHVDRTLTDGLADSSAESGVWWNRRRKKIASIGSKFQADIPEWKNDIYEPDPKWLGTRIWPLDKNEQTRILIERDPAGKGREDTCGCEYPGSYDCVRFHLYEKTRKIKLELGSAFYHWKFNCMGEKVALSWTTKDKQKFHDIVKSSPLSEDDSFSYWPELFKSFPHKSRESLVSYYFNVFLLRRIGQQSRMNASNIDSDDDESGYGPRSICFGRDPKLSILCSPKKARLDPK